MEVFIILVLVIMGSLAAGAVALSWSMYFKPARRRRFERNHHREKSKRAVPSVKKD